jgi:ArsR family metal-binding transcriptional regulator
MKNHIVIVYKCEVIIFIFLTGRVRMEKVKKYYEAYDDRYTFFFGFNNELIEGWKHA